MILITLKHESAAVEVKHGEGVVSLCYGDQGGPNRTTIVLTANEAEELVEAIRATAVKAPRYRKPDKPATRVAKGLRAGRRAHMYKVLEARGPLTAEELIAALPYDERWVRKAITRYTNRDDLTVV